MSAMHAALRICVVTLAIALGVVAFQHAISHAVHDVIASEPAPLRIESRPLIDLRDCGLDHGWNPSSGPHLCHLDMRPLPAKPATIPTMTKEQSEAASLWFVLAALAVPLSLGAAAILAFIALRDRSQDEQFD